MLSEELKARRINAGLSQEALAERLNVGVYLIQAIEEGETSPHQALSKSAMVVWGTACRRNPSGVMQIRSNITSTIAMAVSFCSSLIVVGIVAFLLLVFILSHSNPVNNDRVILITILSLGFIARKDRDLVFTCLLCSALLVINDLLFPILINSSLELSITIYIFTLLSAHFLTRNLLKKIIFLTVFLVVSMELYWYLEEYSRPSITWYIHCIFIDIIVISLIKQKPKLLYKKNFRFSDLKLYDKFFLFHYYFYFLLILLVVIEYGIRHILHYHTLNIHYAYPYIQGVFSLIFILLLVESIIRHKLWK
ncbi:helix-turn-helix domain-containing protein [Fluctibacter corallii]|uniref:helix-turn-helix domain-containing protein n=1 Tax=Fluctibacter corallii TaxID=2984329 RepID=UPI00385081C5